MLGVLADLLEHGLERVLGPAVRAVDTATDRHLYDLPDPGPPVEQVDVLRDHRLDESGLLELRERAVRPIRLDSGEHREPPRVERPDLLDRAGTR